MSDHLTEYAQQRDDRLLDAAVTRLRTEVRAWVAAGAPNGADSRWPVRLTAPEAAAVCVELDDLRTVRREFARLKDHLDLYTRIETERLRRAVDAACTCGGAGDEGGRMRKIPQTEVEEDLAAGRALKRLHAATVADLQAANASRDEAARELAVYADHVAALEARLSRARGRISALRERLAKWQRWVPLEMALELCDEMLRAIEGE